MKWTKPNQLREVTYDKENYGQRKTYIMPLHTIYEYLVLCLDVWQVSIIYLELQWHAETAKEEEMTRTRLQRHSLIHVRKFKREFKIERKKEREREKERERDWVKECGSKR